MDLRTSVSFDPEILAELEALSREVREEHALDVGRHRTRALWTRAQDVIASAALRVRGHRQPLNSGH